MRLRNLSRKNVFFSMLYQKASMIKTSAKRNISDEDYLKQKYKENTGKELRLNNPQTFNEKLQWLKLHDRNPLYTILADKFAVRKYIAEKIGEEYLIPLYGVWNRIEDIDFNKLPNEFVLKCTHDCGSIIICRDKNTFDIDNARKKLSNALKRNYYYVGREWPYKNIPPKIIAEKYMVDESGDELKDYKFFCFNGVPKLIQVDFNRFKGHKRNIYSVDWEFIDAKINYPNSPNSIIEKPEKLGEMLKSASILSYKIPHVRIDFYSIKQNVYFGEMTFYHGGGTEKFTPSSLNEQLGSWIDLSLAYGSNLE